MPRRTSAPPLQAVPDPGPLLSAAEQGAAEAARDEAIDAHTRQTPEQIERAAGTDADNLEAAQQWEENKARTESVKTTRKRPAAKKTEPDSPRLDAGTEVEVRPGDIVLSGLDDQAEYLSVLYYGAEGTGKSTALARMTLLPGKGRVLIVNAEGGMKRRALTAQGVDTSRIAVWPPEGQRVTFEGLEALFFKLAGDLEADPDSWLGTGWDSVTDIHQELLDQVVEEEMRKQTEILAKAGGKARAGNITLRDRFDNDRDDYRKMSNQVRTLLRKFRYLPCHFAVTALMRRDEDEATKRVMYGPSVTPALQTDLTGYVDQVLLCKVAEIKGGRVFFAQTSPTRTERAKDRHNVLPAEMVNPSFDRLYAYMVGEAKEDTDPLQSALTPGTAIAGVPATNRMAEVLTEGSGVPTTASGRVKTSGNRRRPAATKTATAPGGFTDDPPF